MQIDNFVKAIIFAKPGETFEGRRGTLYTKSQSNICSYCFKVFDNLTVDHIVPKAKGGDGSYVNSVGACIDCNRKKANTDLIIFLAKMR